MTRLEQLEIAALSMIAEGRYYDAAAADPATRAKRKAEADQVLRELDAAVWEAIAEGSSSTSGSPATSSGNPDAVESEAP